MKVVLFLVCFLLVGWMVRAQEECLVKGKIKGLEDGAVLVLYRHSGRLLTPVGRDTVKNGIFSFKIHVGKDTVDCMALSGRGRDFPNTTLDVWVAAGKKIKISGVGKLLRCWQVKSSIPEQKKENRYLEATCDLLSKQQELWLKAEELREWGNQNSGSLTDEKKDELRQRDSIFWAKSDSIGFLISEKKIELMKKTTVDEVWIDKLFGLSLSCRYGSEKFPYREEVEALYKRLTAQQKQTEKGKTITVHLFPPEVIQVGEQMADGDLYDLEGRVHHLSDYHGKFILLDFWSCGCGPCMMALPEMKKVAEEYRDRLVVVSLSTDDRKNWEKISREKDMTWENLNDLQGENGLYAKYGVNGIPHYVVIAPDGKVIHSWSGYGKGIIRLTLNRLLDRYGCVMSVRQEEGNKIVEYPEVAFKSSETLAVDKVVMNDTATVVYVKAYFLPHYWLIIAKNTRLVAENGTESWITKAEGIDLDKKFVMPASGKAEFVLTFGPLPFQSKKFDFIEGDCKDCFRILGIALEK